MNRAIKFRGWDKTTEKMIYDLGEYVGDSLLNYLVCQFDDMTIGIMREGDGELLSVMQFTGLKDRHGREIYEGDILRGTSEKIRIRDNKRTGEYVTKTVTIEWQDEWGRFQLKNTSGNFELLPCTKQDWIAEFYEVIGNIFENPELCKG